jgi:hypothetical protein
VAPAGEFLEVMNISGTQAVDLGGCAFTEGVEYVFPAGTVLAPGVRLVIPGAAFLNGTALSNGGERITLVRPGGVVVKSFVYGDRAPWPETADGFGPSLVLMAPLTNPDPGLAENWRASVAAGGNPGADDGLYFTGDGAADEDGDGWSNLLEYALGSDPQVVPGGMTFTVPRVANADSAAIGGEYSTVLSGWLKAELIGSTATSLTYRVPEAAQGATRLFVRATVRLR